MKQKQCCYRNCVTTLCCITRKRDNTGSYQEVENYQKNCRSLTSKLIHLLPMTTLAALARIGYEEKQA